MHTLFLLHLMCIRMCVSWLEKKIFLRLLVDIQIVQTVYGTHLVIIEVHEKKVMKKKKPF